MASTDTTKNAETIIVSTLDELLRRRDANDIVVRPESSLLADLGLDSLELAELSAALEDAVGHDPFSEGILPETVAELVAFYNPDPQPQ